MSRVLTLARKVAESRAKARGISLAQALEELLDLPTNDAMRRRYHALLKRIKESVR